MIAAYRAEWFDPRTGKYQDVGGGKLNSSVIGVIQLPDLPSDIDWGLRLTYASPAPRVIPREVGTKK